MTFGDFFYPFEFFSRNYLASIVLAVGCSYVGVFVILRRIVFVGVALAEFSVLGIAAAFLALTLVGPGLLYDLLHDHGPTGFALLFAFLGVFLLTFATVGKTLPRDGLIGLYYSAASALALLFVWKSAFGKEELVSIVSGSILFVDDARLAALSLSYLAVALVHALFFKEILFVSFDREMARTLGLRAGLYDFLLYASIGVLISIGVRVGGVLLVFGYLVIPPIGGLLLAERFGAAARISLVQSVTGSCAGLYLAYRFDYPTGPMIVACLAAEAAMSAVAREMRWLRAPLRVAAAVLALPVIASLAVAISNYAAGTHVARETPREPGAAPAEGEPLAQHLIEHDLASPAAETRVHAVQHLAQDADPRAAAAVRGAIDDPDPTVQLAAIEAVVARGDAEAVIALETLVSSGRAALARDVGLAAADALERLGSPKALSAWLSLLSAEGEAVIRSDAIERLRRVLGDDAGFDPMKEPAENRDALLRLAAKVDAALPRIEWDPRTKSLRAKSP